MAHTTECLNIEVVARLVPYYTDVIVPDLHEGKVVLVVAQGNSLRGLVKYIDGISDADIVGLNIPTGSPLCYELDENLAPIIRDGYYLDPDAAAAARQRWPRKAQADGLPVVFGWDGRNFALSATVCRRHVPLVSEGIVLGS